MTTSLEKSILHWEENVAAKTPHDAKLGPVYCALCMEFRVEDNCSIVSCTTCPIKKHTGEDGCTDTPHSDVVYFYNKWKGDDKLRLDYVKAATAELEFLKGLRE